MSESEERIIALIDMDCFFCQVESREKPELKGKPMVVSQFNMVLAVNYEARDLGISRFVRGDEAKEKYPDVNVVSVPERRGKGDISKYRSAGAEVINVLKQHCPIVERASIDEAFLDITDLVDRRMESTLISSSNVEKYLTNTFVVGYCDTTNDEDKRYDGMKKWINESFDNMGGEQERKLAIGAIIIEELRSEIYEKCEFKCSAGISYNKVLAKLACGLHKPNKQTILSMSSVPELFSTLSVNKIRNLGGKIGMAIVEKLNCNVMSDLLCFSMDQLEKQFDKKTAMWLFNIARGIDHEQVKSRLISKSIGASKNFWGEEVITEIQKLKAWIDILSEDISERLEQDLQDNSRRATALTVSYQYVRDKKNISQSRTSTLTSYKAEKISSHAFDIIKKTMQTPVSYLSISATKFIDYQKNSSFVNYFQVKPRGESKEKTLNEMNDEQHEKNILNVSNISVNKNDSVDESFNSIKLQELFPDLDNIDSSIVELLPSELQQEAKIYLKSNDKDLDQTNGNKSKSTSEKIPKSKTKPIENFFIKKTTNFDEISGIKCNECSAIIDGEKYLEHCDYHIAQNLQKNINKLENNQKRNRQSSQSPPDSHKKTKTILSYFNKI
ncbi:hypothetical protein HCN44_010127 [Aphidius gifuensis]|uniref:DNA polymerase eta n=1 Tax=Aphidius gifuensis TaxID=684658 RepID=A0A834XXM8_APHGI|nr:hypothetical protein HCN44_010127 [Aphidius gifuensis]